ncbi:MAG: family 20 glycosylhydrolase [Gemmatimonadales bacterium]
MPPRRFASVLAAIALARFGPMTSAQNPPAVASAPARAAVAAFAPTHHLMPVPASVRWGEGRLRLDSTFGVAVLGYRDARLTGAVYRMIRRLEARVGVTLTHQPAGAAPRGRGGATEHPTAALVFVADTSRAALVVEAQSPGQAVQTETEDESYSLDVSPTRATIRASTVVGVIRGLETFLQLLEGDRSGFSLPVVAIQDRPRFPWRGILIDVGRHFEPVEVIERNLDAMAAVKLNVLHWHLSDDQGFRVESRRFPKLQELASDGLFYTQAEVRAVVAYARDRGIRVVPEFDVPGHSTSWFVAYPEYASAPGPFAIERQFGVFDPTFDPTNERVYRFLDRFIGEMAALFPDPYWHVGGDENSGVEWSANPRIQAFKAAHGFAKNEALQTYFNQRLLPILARHGKRMVGWDEILEPGLPTTSLIQSWRGRASLDTAAHRGYAAILSSGYYLDHQRTAEYHYAVDPLPANSTLGPEEAARILGGEACMWGEHVGPETIDSRIWPRAAAIAERLWSPKEVTDVGDMYRRLAVVSDALEEVGVTHASHTGRMLRRLAGSVDITPLAEFLEYAQPAYFGERSQLQQTTQLTPLTHLVDAARPDPLSRWRIGALVDSFLADPRQAAGRTVLAGMFEEWGSILPRLQAAADSSPLAAEAFPAAVVLADLGSAGLEALTFLGGGAASPDGWLARVTPVLDRAEGPLGLLRLPFAPALRRLIAAAGQQH